MSLTISSIPFSASTTLYFAAFGTFVHFSTTFLLSTRTAEPVWSSTVGTFGSPSALIAASNASFFAATVSCVASALFITSTASLYAAINAFQFVSSYSDLTSAAPASTDVWSSALSTATPSPGEKIFK